MNKPLIRAMFEQYFCNVCELQDDQLVSLYYKGMEALDKDEDVYWSDFPFTELVVWQPFEEVMPVHIFNNISEGILTLEGIMNND